MQFFVANLTPFDNRGRVDLARLRAHTLWLSMQGVDGFVPTGSTGEFLYLTDREREAIHRTVLDTARGRPVYPCTWDPSPATSAYLTDAAREQGAAGVLLPPPLYYPLDDDAIELWFRQAARNQEIKILGYHNPGAIPNGLSASLFRRLRAEGVLAGMKDSSRDVHRLRRLAASDPGAVLAGGDDILPEVASLKGIGGFVSALGNVWPAFCLRILRGGETQLAQALSERVQGLRRAGGVRALKALAGMGCRAPIPPARRDLLDLLPGSEAPF